MRNSVVILAITVIMRVITVITVNLCFPIKVIIDNGLRSSIKYTFEARLQKYYVGQDIYKWLTRRIRFPWKCAPHTWLKTFIVFSYEPSYGLSWSACRHFIFRLRSSEVWLRSFYDHLFTPSVHITSCIHIIYRRHILMKPVFLRKKYISCGEKFISCGKNIFLAEKNIFLAEKNISCGKKYSIYFFHPWEPEIRANVSVCTSGTPVPALIKPNQLDPWIKDKLKSPYCVHVTKCCNSK